MEVKRISTEDTLPIRQLMLRPNGTVNDCRFPGDNDEQTFHLGVFEGNQLTSVASFYFSNHSEISDQHQFQIRGIAASPNHQGKGHGSTLLKTAIPLIKQNQCTTIWCNARLSSQGFYQKLGFTPQGDIFHVEEIGDHQLVVLDLK